MITNVTNVFVGKGIGMLGDVTNDLSSIQFSTAELAMQKAGGFVYRYVNDHMHLHGAESKCQIGLVTDKVVEVEVEGEIKYMPVIKWSHAIQPEHVINGAVAQYSAPDTEDTAVITFNNANGDDVKRILLRITYKDMETRYRKWTETYEVIVAPETEAADIAKAFAQTLKKNAKRNRFTFKVEDNVLTLTAKKYTDDDSEDTINVAKKVRFDVNMYYTMPNADGWASKNKYPYAAVYTSDSEAAEDETSDAVIVKTAGTSYQASAKLVRDREAWAMGYDGILNRGNGTWPIIKPKMNVDLTKNYDVVTIEFTNEYRAADDIVRRTRECLEIYDIAGTGTFDELGSAIFAHKDD